jgi:phage-related protein
MVHNIRGCANIFACTFYRTPSGTDVVADWFRGLNKEDRRRVGLDLLRVQENWPIGMPVCKPLGKGLWEIRSALSGNKIARILFFLGDAEICVVHGFIKKTMKTPPQELALAYKRMKEMKI